MLKSSCRLFLLVASLTLCSLIGCSSNSNLGDDQSAEEVTSQPFDIRLAIVGNQPLAEEIDRLWESSNGGRVNVTLIEEEELRATGRDSELASFDILIYPARYKGQLAGNDLLFPIEQYFLDNPELNIGDFLENERGALTHWDGKDVALSLGQPQYALFANRQMLADLGLQMPTTWEELNLTLSTLEQEGGGQLGDIQGLVQPGRDSDLVANFFARVACYIVTPGRYSNLFDLQTMEPLIDSPPFIRALDELAESTRYGQLASPHEALDALMEGQALFAITWPAKSWIGGEETSSQEFVEAQALQVSSLPSSQYRYDYSKSEWTERNPAALALVGFNGQLASIGRECENPVLAQEFLIWLAGKKTMDSTAGLCAENGVARLSQLLLLDQWTGQEFNADALDDYMKLVQSSADSNHQFCWPAIHESHRYIDILEAGIRRVLEEQADPQQVLSDVKIEWEKITAEIGMEKQRAAFRASVGL